MMLAVVIAFVLLGAAVLALAALALWLSRSRERALQQRSEKEAGKDMKNLVSQVAYAMELAGSATGRPTKSIAEAKQMAFVVTDIEGSTQLSVAGRTVYDQLLAIHDQLMREGIAKFNGTQIVTEGDSFLVAFPCVAEAVAFCQDLQYKLLDTPWPRAVLRLPGCQPVLNAEGDVMIQGPRVRVGVHWALPGLVACRPHGLTKAPMMVGVAVSIAQEVSDAAHGGQILISQDAWNQLRGYMARAGFPIVRRLGLFQLQAEEGKASWLYTLDGSLARPLRRDLPPTRKLVRVWPPPGAAMAGDWGLYVSDPPTPLPGGSDTLAFVFLRLRLPPGKRLRRRLYTAHSSPHRAAHHHQVPSSVLLALQQLFVKQAQQFEGYMFGSDALTERQGYFSFAFACSGNALRFCHTIQVCLMYNNRWPSEAAEYYGQTVVGIDGRLVFKGPRIAASIHCGSDYYRQPIASYHPTAAPGADYSGPAVALARALSDAAHGGQVLLTEEAWQGVQGVLQVMPTLLSGRSFKPPNTMQQLELGYREAPSVHEPMTMVFVKVAKPTAVTRAEASATDLGEEQVLEAITAYQLAVGQYAALARGLLPAYGGYECKEPEPGKFTMAFGCLTDAIAWASHVQKDLLALDWPPALLLMQGCEELRGEQGQRLWRGLRVRMGMAYGYINVKKPMNTGRADYFGELANTAARVAALAAPGQVLVESSQVDVAMPDGTTLLLEELPTYLPVKWAACGLAQGASVGFSRHGSVTDGGAPSSFGPQGLAAHGPRYNSGLGGGGRARRASYSATPSEMTAQLMAMRRKGSGSGAEFGHAAGVVTGSRLSSATGAFGRVEHIELRALGKYLLRGLDNPKVLYQALPETLLERSFVVATEALSSVGGLQGTASDQGYLQAVQASAPHA
ncbi:Adenylate cyclase [Tetrabaena socialis]|uniref:Adenylate cyclase n=1 Tax=Tetrabaena socialis TaxID=47790 RepID=A0A2J8ACR9_9CHLO|nr:Adenylate cyclase [Tetrabaena socialis]|eukprot:PNH10309.1 Adenylate cyclase [Tetrabaena socialis]